MEFLGDLLANYTLRTVGMGAVFLGAVNGVLGAFAVLRKQSLLGDAISHAALPGIALAFLLTGSKATLVLLLGAAAAGWVGTLFVMNIVKNTRVKYDSALGLVLSVFFGIGLVLLTYIQRMPVASQAGLDRFLFGQAATLLARDVATIGLLGAGVLLIVLAVWKEFKLLCFDPDFARSLGFPIRWLDVLLITLLVTSIVIGLQTVGVVLMSAMVVAPAAAARQWTDRLGAMVAISAFFGALAGGAGALTSSVMERLPTGPTIVLCLTVIVLVSLLVAPNRGVIWKWARERVNRNMLQVEAVLADLHVLAARHDDPGHGHPISVLRTMSIGHGGVDRSLEVLRERGFVRKTADGTWSLTPRGLEEAKRLEGRRGEGP
ncbi:MAG TPA: ABC transporter [Deltaproteobacteria bacterium]|nr:MAG: ABC transporter [Deltaproteobacteria bacterium GWA2_65_63]OGP27469.1 MAG: ABC transporter [Deltaproteobacteria bacterium GWB2_65_81]OGP39480.1 MAG: ABC transporter [Deltaproteobacteria bacterium GWC2_66_88]HAM31939.1 ABC transporter [Deltaproteobacteria bacterium]HBG73731.1 ABC transporter [Deltaproteobacteria bacterium]